MHEEKEKLHKLGETLIISSLGENFASSPVLRRRKMKRLSLPKKSNIVTSKISRFKKRFVSHFWVGDFWPENLGQRGPFKYLNNSIPQLEVGLLDF